MVKAAGSKKNLRELFTCVSLNIYCNYNYISASAYNNNNNLVQRANGICHHKYFFIRSCINIGVYTNIFMYQAFLKLGLNLTICEFSVIYIISPILAQNLLKGKKLQYYFTCIKNAISITRWLRYPSTRFTTPLAIVDDPTSTPI